jgi:Type ISP C-terminal specificity domain/N-6 DNA Methylase
MPGQGEIPERGVVEVKGLAEEVLTTSDTKQVSKYWQRYRLVLVTNYREFLLIGVDPAGGGQAMRLEGFSLAATDTAFWQSCARPRLNAKAASFVEYLRRALTHLAPLTRPADLAWLLASYARDALARVESVATLPALANLRSGLEQALGLRFDAAKGEHFFRSTLVQTLFYGIFSAWVQWSRDQQPGSTARFDWHAAGWSLHVPMVGNLFEQVATPSRLGPLGLIEVLGWTGAALDRVDRATFFSTFDDRLAVQYFYEPFLAAFDPVLRKDFGVWYTPPEIVRYMVNRVDSALRSELGVQDGLADPRVYVLDPCCGTGSFLVETLDLIFQRLQQQGGDALAAQDLKQAALSRVVGFELMPAPFVIAHWQVGLLLSKAGAPLTAGDERAAVYLTNALTGWQPPEGPKQRFMLPELEPERDAAERMKQEVPILVIIGNPPYNAFAGTSPVEEEGLVEPYKEGLRRKWGIRKHNLGELYVRFLRVAERRIVEGTGRGIVCFISSYSYLTDPSFVVVRKHLLQGFNSIWIDSLNGDSRETGKRTPTGDPDPSVFSTAMNPAGITLGTAVGLFVRRGAETEHQTSVRYREFWGTGKREALYESLIDPELEATYKSAAPTRANRFSFRVHSFAANYSEWPTIRELADAEPFSGVQEMRYGGLMGVERQPLDAKLRRYLDPSLTFETVLAENAGPVTNASGFVAKTARERVLPREPFDPNRILRYALMPLDQRWAYHTNQSGIWNRSRPEFLDQVRNDNLFIVSRMMAERPLEGLPIIPVRVLADYHLLRPNVQAIPTRIYQSVGAQSDMLSQGTGSRSNLSARARDWLTSIDWPDPDSTVEAGKAPWLHALAIGCSFTWLKEHGPAIRSDWPRIPLPMNAEALQASAALGARIVDLLDPDKQVPGVTGGQLNAPFAIIGAITRSGGGALSAAELDITVGWGNGGGGRPVMPGQGRTTERTDYTAQEMAEIVRAATRLGETAEELVARIGPPVDIWLNGVAYWSAVPKNVWEFIIGGYLVFKKWLSYRDHEVLGRPITTAEAREASAIIRRLTALIIMQPELNENYRAICESAFSWPHTQNECCEFNS